MHRRFLILLTLLAAPLSGALAEIYQVRAADGSQTFTDQRPEQTHDVIDHKQLNQRSNAYSEPAPATTSRMQTVKLSPVAANQVDAANETGKASTTKPAAAENMTETQCQELYQLDCDHVINWREYALEKCGDDKRCSDEDFLERKYRPRTLAERQQIARRAAMRNHRDEKEIRTFLLRKYTDYCEQQAVTYCSSQRQGRQCVANMQAGCEDPRSLSQFLDQYHLNPAEKKKVIARAKELISQDSQESTEQLIANLIDLLLFQLAM